MATLLVGDVHGCYDELQALLGQAGFDPTRDLLWLTGDLVARGTQSLETLRFLYHLGNAVRVVLGNHDLHLLAVAAGIQSPQPGDNFQAILRAPDRDQLLHWLRHQPLVQQHADLPLLMVHAAVSPRWDLQTTQQCALAVQKMLQSEDHLLLLAAMYGDQPDHWSEQLPEMDRLRYSINVFTRLRFCYPDGRLALHCKQAPTAAPALLIPWFQLPSPTAQTKKIIFGHWASLMGRGAPAGFYAMDTGCVWGESLSLLRWEDQRLFTQAASVTQARSRITKRQA